MIHTRTEAQEVAIPVSIQCNACGQRWSLDPEDAWETQEFVAITLDGGYGNRHWGDLTRIRFHACQDCVAAWIRGFAVEPEAWDIESEVFCHGRAKLAPFSLRPFPAPPEEESADPAPEHELFFEFGEGGT